MKDNLDILEEILALNFSEGNVGFTKDEVRSIYDELKNNREADDELESLRAFAREARDVLIGFRAHLQGTVLPNIAIALGEKGGEDEQQPQPQLSFLEEELERLELYVQRLEQRVEQTEDGVTELANGISEIVKGSSNISKRIKELTERVVKIETNAALRFF